MPAESVGNLRTFRQTRPNRRRGTHTNDSTDASTGTIVTTAISIARANLDTTRERSLIRGETNDVREPTNGIQLPLTQGANLMNIESLASVVLDKADALKHLEGG